MIPAPLPLNAAAPAAAAAAATASAGGAADAGLRDRPVAAGVLQIGAGVDDPAHRPDRRAS